MLLGDLIHFKKPMLKLALLLIVLDIEAVVLIFLTIRVYSSSNLANQIRGLANEIATTLVLIVDLFYFFHEHSKIRKNNYQQLFAPLLP